MRIALFQLHAHEVEGCASTGVPAARIAQLLSMAGGHSADLVVFPEGYPFIANSRTGEPPLIEEAIAELEKMPPCSLAFIVGGYVMENGRERNASFLVHEGRVQEPYFKRVPWMGERFEPGTALLRWSWNEHQVIPLICADVCVPWNEPDGRAAQMLGEAAALGAGPSCPIIVSTFGADLRTPYWTAPLRAWARACNAPVLVAAIAGQSAATFEEGDEKRHYGGGGSGMYWFEDGQDHVWPRTKDSEAVAMYVLDTRVPESSWLPLSGIGYSHALFLAEKAIEGYAEYPALTLMIIEAATEEYASGWVFFYNTREYLEGHREEAALAGNGPIFIERSGAMHMLPTHLHWKDWLSQNGFCSEESDPGM